MDGDVFVLQNLLYDVRNIDNFHAVQLNERHRHVIQDMLFISNYHVLVDDVWVQEPILQAVLLATFVRYPAHVEATSDVYVELVCTIQM